MIRRLFVACVAATAALAAMMTVCKSDNQEAAELLRSQIAQANAEMPVGDNTMTLFSVADEGDDVVYQIIVNDADSTVTLPPTFIRDMRATILESLPAEEETRQFCGLLVANGKNLRYDVMFTSGADTQPIVISLEELKELY